MVLHFYDVHFLWMFPISMPIFSESSLFLCAFVMSVTYFYIYFSQNSRLTNNGGYVTVTGSNQRLDYFPGANGVRDSCGCGATQSCDDPTVRCNCDIEDGKERKDFGLIINKEHLPVVGLTAVIGVSRSGTYEIGNLQCSQKQFGEFVWPF